jgi:hypothetical protein
MRRWDILTAVASEVAVSEIIGDDEHDIGPALLRGGYAGGAGSREKEQIASIHLI